MTTEALWIQRKVADDIFERIISDDGSVAVFLVQASAGMGKTYLARDLGTRLGSATGYEPARSGRIAWSGILDVYDPDTNSNRGIERRLIEALQISGLEFDEYHAARELYEAWFKSGISGSGLEQQRQNIERAFAEGLHNVTAACRPVIVLDTIERLETIADPAQTEAGLTEDTAAVIGWLAYQISQMRGGAVLLLGREFSQLEAALHKAIAKAELPAHVQVYPVTIPFLDEPELNLFYANRLSRYPQLHQLLTAELQVLLNQRTGGNPLLLDLALQTLLEVGNPAALQRTLSNGELADLERDLLNAYMRATANPNRQTLLRYLALARNGLFAELLQVLEPTHATELVSALTEMEELPFLKIRTIAFPTPAGVLVNRRTYFLHDAMYSICDDVLLRPEEVIRDTRRILGWYDQQITEIEGVESKRAAKLKFARAADDLYVQSLFYRMRVDPQTGYQWYLRIADWAIRNAETSLDMRLRDAMNLFLLSADPNPPAEASQSLRSKIDRENVTLLMPELFSDYRLDSVTLWVKRLSVRGKNDQAAKLGQQLQPRVEGLFAAKVSRYALAFAEYLLWYGQAIMYSYHSVEAMARYERALKVLEATYPREMRDSALRAANLGEFPAWRMTLILGRIYNNMGYTHWMYEGKFSRAVREFQRAINLFRDAVIEEELANSSDNMGRVYINLGYEFRAIQLIRAGLNLRQKLGLVYREALSYNSLAIALSRFDHTPQALQAAEEALRKYRQAGVDRGIGLGLLTHGEVCRVIADSWRETELPIAEAERYAEQAETDLRDALRIFTGPVKEPIREVQARNAMACCYRTKLLILEHLDKPPAPAAKEMTFTQGRINFQQAIRAAADNHYLLDELDSLQDMAVLFFRARRYSEAETYLAEVVRKVPEDYRLTPEHLLEKIDDSERVDAYYKLMGQVEMLTGAIAAEHGLSADTKLYPRARTTPGKDPIEAMLHYLLGVMYFSYYSDETFVHRQVYARIHKRYQEISPDLVRSITQTHVPQWKAQYKLPGDLVDNLLLDVFGQYEY